MLWPVEKLTRYAAIRNRMADGSEGRRMRCIKGARHAHAVMRAQGRTPGDEGRARIAANRGAKKFAQRMSQRYGSEWRVTQPNLDEI